MARMPGSKAARDIGAALAKNTVGRRNKAEAARNKVLQARSNLPAEKVTAGPRGSSRTLLRSSPHSAGVLVAEGDSWFDYPFHDVLRLLEDKHAYDVESVAHRGDTAEAMAYSEGQLDEFAGKLQKVLRRGSLPKAILFSGGGNDMAGSEFAILLNHAGSSISGLNESILQGVIDQRLFDAYVTVLSAISSVSAGLAGVRIPILLHGYDYPVADGRGVLGGAGILPGPWLDPGFRQKGYPKSPLRSALMVRLIDRFNAMLLKVSQQPGFGHVKYLDLRGTLSNGSDYKQWWANELHPTKRGFEAVAARFAQLIG